MNVGKRAGISIAQFAERDGCSAALVKKYIAAGRLPKLPDGSLDPALVGTDWHRNNRGLLNDVSISEAGGNTPEEVAIRATETAQASGKLPTYNESAQKKEHFLAMLRELEFEQKSGSIIDLKVAQDVFFEVSRAQRDAWLSFPSGSGPLIAADLGLPADKVTAVLTEYVHRQIKSIGEPEANLTGR